MTKNINSWNLATNQWIRFWSESSSVIWDSWFILLGLDSKSKTTEASKELVSYLEESSQSNCNLIDNYVEKLVNLTELSQKFDDWQQLQKFWLQVADILLHYNSEHTSEKLSNFIHDLENFELVNQEKEISTENTIHQNKLPQENNGINSFEILPQVQLVEKNLRVKEEDEFTDKAQDYRRFEQHNQDQAQTIEQLQAKITELEKENKLNKDKILLSKKDSFADLSEITLQVQWLEEQLKLKEEQLKISEQKIADKAKDYWLLQQENQDKSQKIEQLQSQIGELESIASIGTKQLNKWRSKTFFN